ncbi:MAG TPA: extracellular solute-binding protein [Chloroflexota bacterium]|nr:extracellular solute-binding protein [Chloroflexota bacterium]
MGNRKEAGAPGGRVSRRAFLRTAALGGGAALALGCQPSAQGTATTAGEAPAGSPATGGSAGSPGWQAQWNALVDAAKGEGSLVISGPPTPDVRTAVPAAFKQRFGIEVEYVGGRTTELVPKLKAERLASQYTLDAMIAGAQSLYTDIYPDHMLDPIPPILVNPEATDPSKWLLGHPWFMDPEGQYILRLANYVSSAIAINTDYVKPGELKAYADLLAPRYRGKISVWDPIRPGSGWNTANYLLYELGEDYIQSLYRGQDVGVSADGRQLSDWMARGRYPISLGLGPDEIERLKKDGFPIAALTDLADAAGYVTAGFGLAVLVNRAPHPNAAKLFLNWLAMKEGAEVFNRAQVLVSTRADVDNAWAPPYIVPKQGVNYFDTYDWEFTLNGRKPEAVDRLRQLTGMS